MFLQFVTLLAFHLTENTSNVLSHLPSLDVSKSSGLDGLSAAFLKELAMMLTNLFDQSLHDSVIPVALKQSQITVPYSPKGRYVCKCNDPFNHRPISAVPILAKVLEMIVSMQFSQYLE